MALTGSHAPNDLGHPSDHNLIDAELARLETAKLGVTAQAADAAALGGTPAAGYLTEA